MRWTLLALGTGSAAVASGCALSVDGQGGAPSPSPTLGFAGRVIYLDAPAPGATVSGSAVAVRGRVTVSPFEATLRGRVYDAAGAVVGQGPVMVQSGMGTAGPFAGSIPLEPGPAGPARVEIAEVSMKDGAILVSASVAVRLAARP